MMASKAIVVTGAGGVGKTTVAAALGVKAASQGKKTLVLTVDPASLRSMVTGWYRGRFPSHDPPPHH